MLFQALIASGDDALVNRLAASLNDRGVVVESVPQIGPALAALTCRRFDAVLLDCELDGAIDLVRVVRQTPLNQRAVVFAVVAGHEEVKAANRQGANFVLTRPIQWEVVNRTMRAAHSMIIRERRQHIREKVRVPAKFRVNGKTLDGALSDLTERGLAIRVGAGTPIGTRVEVEFTLPGMKEQIECLGSVAWTNGELVGVEFMELTPASMPVIMKWLDRHSRRRMNRQQPRVIPDHTDRALSWGY